MQYRIGDDMYEKQLFVIQKKIAETVKGASENPEAAVVNLMKLKKETEGFASPTSPEFYNAAATINEAAGDIWLRAKKIAEAETSYKEMVQISGKLYELDKTKFDYRLGFSYYKLASFYRTVLQCGTLNPTPKVLNEHQQKIFTVTEGLYKNAIACTMENVKKGSLRYVDLHATCMSELLVLLAAVGNYQSAIACGKDGVRLEKAIYEKLDDKAHSFRLANRMNALASVYTFMKNVQLAMETLEDAIFVLEEHEEEDPITFGVMLARNYLTLGSCYSQMKEEADNADTTYQKGLERMVEVNKKTNNRLIRDVITSYMIVGDHYKRKKNEEAAKAHYGWAMKMASDLFHQTKDSYYENIMNRLRPFV